MKERHVQKEQLIVLESTEHPKQRNLIWTLLCPLVPLILISLFIKGDLSSHPQDWNENKWEKWLKVPHALPARLRSNVWPVQIPFYCSSQFPAGWQLSAWCWQVMRKPSVSKEPAYVKYMAPLPAGITLFHQIEITGRERLCPAYQQLKK